MERYITLLEELKKANVEYKIDSRKAKILRAQVIRTKNAEKTLELIGKLKYKYVPSPASSSGQAYLIDGPDKFYVIVPGGNKGAQKKQLTPTNLGLTERKFTSKTEFLSIDPRLDGGNKGAQKKQLTPTNLGLTERKFTSKTEFLSIVEKAITKTDLPILSKTIAKHLIRAAAGVEKFDPKMLEKTNEQEMNNFRNDFGEVLCGMDSLNARRAKEIFFPGKINEYFDYKENNTKMSVKGSRSSDVAAFGSGNSVSHIKEELTVYKTKTNKESEVVTALLLLAQKSLYEFLDFLSTKLPILRRIKADPVLRKTLGLTDSGLTMFVAKFKTADTMYKVLPDSPLGRAKGLNLKPTKNTILFWLLTNVAKEMNDVYGKEINQIGQTVYSDRGSIRLFIFSKTEFIFETRTYKDFKIKFHYWGNEGSPLNNWPGLKVTKS